MISFENIVKSYRGKRKLHDVSFRVKKGERLVLLGGSGSGKTTLLKMVIRLIDPTAGRILLDGEDIVKKNLIALRRQVGYAIQDTGLFEHMTVQDNIAILLRLLGYKEAFIQERVYELLCMVRLDPEEFGQKLPRQLSGGQGQLVGAARVFAHWPKIALMDEPFGGLDPITRSELQSECIDLQTKLDTTMIFVTHDVQEAVKMGDRIVLLREGEVQQIGTPADLICYPKNEFVAAFFSHQKFQLFMNMKKLGKMALQQGRPQRTRLGVNQTLLDAMNTFFEEEADTISIYRKEVFLGNISKELILQELQSLWRQGNG
ncbi:MAG: ABC transporter ATP-binding protein [Chlamydiota bacterium]